MQTQMTGTTKASFICEQCGKRSALLAIDRVRCEHCGWDGRKRSKEERTPRPRISPLCFGTSPLAGRLTAEGCILVLPLPPTKNHEPRDVHERNRMQQHWQTLSQTAWMLAGRPRFDAVEIRPIFHVRHPNRDDDGCIGFAWKGLQDGLRRCLVPDDNPRHLHLLAVEFVVSKQPRVELDIRRVR